MRESRAEGIQVKIGLVPASTLTTRRNLLAFRRRKIYTMAVPASWRAYDCITHKVTPINRP